MAPKRQRTMQRRATSRESSFVDCPACEVKVISSLVNQHLDWDCQVLRQKKQLPIRLTAELRGKPSVGLGLHSGKSHTEHLVSRHGDELVSGLEASLNTIDSIECRDQHMHLSDTEVWESARVLEASSCHPSYTEDDQCPAINTNSPKLDNSFNSIEHLLHDERGRSGGEASTPCLGVGRDQCWQFITASLPSKTLKGHYVLENFISEKEEQDIVCFLDMDLRNPWRLSTFNGLHLGKGYGMITNLRKRCVCPANFEMPKVLMPILERMRESVSVLKDFCPNETNAIDYCKHKGHWLKPHVDDRQALKFPSKKISPSLEKYKMPSFWQAPFFFGMCLIHNVQMGRCSSGICAGKNILDIQVAGCLVKNSEDGLVCAIVAMSWYYL